MEGGRGFWEDDNNVRTGFSVSPNCFIKTEQRDIRTKIWMIFTTKLDGKLPPKSLQIQGGTDSPHVP